MSNFELRTLNFKPKTLNIKLLSFITTTAISLLFLSCNERTQNTASPKSESLYTGLEFEMPEVIQPTFPDYAVRITDFGAVPGGETLNTTAFAEAINAVTEKGGGKVIVPAGIWLTGPIVLKSNINLHTEAGALVLFSRNFDDYPLVSVSFEGLDTYRCVSPITGKELENIAITGSGVFDGSGDAWRPVKKSKLTSSQWKNLVSSGGVLNAKEDTWYPSESSQKGAEGSEMNVPPFTTREEHETVKDFLRPVMVSLVACKKVLLDGPTFQNSPAWCLHPLMCEHITLQNLTVRNPWYSQNGDGVDLESCKNAMVYQCSFDVGDDAICIKSGKNEDGRRRGIPTENVIISNATVYHGHGGFTVGSEMSGGVRNIHVSNLTFIGTDVGLRFKSTRGRGGVVENIYISAINMIDIPAEAILFDLYYTGNSPIPEGDEKVSAKEKAAMAASIPPVTEETPAFRDIYIRDVVCKGAGRAVLFQGLPEMNLRNMKMENVTIVSKKGLYCIDSDGVIMKNVRIMASEGPAMFFYNSKQVTVEGFQYAEESVPTVQIRGDHTQAFHFVVKDFKNATVQIAVDGDVPEGAVEVK